MTRSERELVCRRAGGRCEYCRVPEGYGMGLHIDHIRPRFHAGGEDNSNLAYSCAQCNWRKGTNVAGFDPDTGAQTPLFNPRQDRWDEHFRLDGERILGITVVGRTSVWILDVNNEDRLEFRAHLRELNLWP